MSSQTIKPMLRSYQSRFPHGKSSETAVPRITAQLQVSEVVTSLKNEICPFWHNIWASSIISDICISDFLINTLEKHSKQNKSNKNPHSMLFLLMLVSPRKYRVWIRTGNLDKLTQRIKLNCMSCEQVLYKLCLTASYFTTGYLSVPSMEAAKGSIWLQLFTQAVHWWS